jgi:hypothetical protein
MTDDIDGTGNIVTSGTVDTAIPWTYVLTYDYTDAGWNAATQVTRTITVEDTTPPVITLNGVNSITIETWSTYSDAWATWTDEVDGSWSVVASGSVNTLIPWTYSLTFDYTDTAGNLATQVIRTVIVEDQLPL